MVIDNNFHLSDRFISRELGYNVAVIFDMSSLEVQRNASEIIRLGRIYPSVFFVEKDPVWNRIIVGIMSNSNSPIFLIQFYSHGPSVRRLQNFVELTDILGRLPPIHLDE